MKCYKQVKVAKYVCLIYNFFHNHVQYMSYKYLFIEHDTSVFKLVSYHVYFLHLYDSSCTVYLILLHTPSFLLEIRVIIKILKNPGYPINVDWFSLEWSNKNIQNGRLKKTHFQLCQFSKFLMKISWIGLWVNRIDWC